MAYIFPINPVDGQLYPNPAIAGSLQYIWVAGQNAWLIYSPLGVQSVSGLLPIVVTNNNDNPVVSILPATISARGTMSPEDKLKLDNLPSTVGTVQSVGTGVGLKTDRTGNAPITTSGLLSLVPPSGGAIGGVKAGPNIVISPDGTISGTAGTVTSINCVDGILAAPNPITTNGTITLRPASNLLIGGVIVGAGLRVDGSGLITLASDILENGVAAWGAFSNDPEAAVPTFTLREGYNISSISYIGGPKPVARVTFRTDLPDVYYGVSAQANTYFPATAPTTSQLATTLNFSDKTTLKADLKSFSVYTTINTGPTGIMGWNTWNSGGINGKGCFTEFDFLAYDTRIN